MKKYIRITALILSILLLFCGCQKIEDKSNDAESTGETVTKAPENVDTAKPASDTTAQEDTTLAENTDTVPDDGKVHVTAISLDKYEVSLTVGSNDMPMVTMSPANAENVAEIWESDNTAVATVSQYGRITGVSEGTCTVTVTSADNNSVKATVKVTVKANNSTNTGGTVEGATYIKGMLVVNKTYALPSDYNPGVDPTAQSALNQMISAAKSEGISLWIASGFRSYDRQKTLYNNYVARDGKAEADRYSARPGHSEHQTGLAFDLNSLEQSFGETPEGKWIAANCWKYGFILRYPKDKEAQTGYMYEPWHVRYVGTENAKSIYNSGLCLEEYLGITSVYAN
ncbi:MAG: D-alanyl-D-alanine carboxypeptidase family protein [Clostridia bacterium]|nr:D-alanyl-D-alanine carboxypeptidase family protein [Clostridia bacterium]